LSLVNEHFRPGLKLILARIGVAFPQDWSREVRVIVRTRRYEVLKNGKKILSFVPGLSPDRAAAHGCRPDDQVAVENEIPFFWPSATTRRIAQARTRFRLRCAPVA